MLTSLATVCNNPVLDNATLSLALVSLQLCPIGGARTHKAKSTVPSGCRVDPRRAGTPGDRFATCRLYCSRITFYLPPPRAALQIKLRPHDVVRHVIVHKLIVRCFYGARLRCARWLWGHEAPGAAVFECFTSPASSCR